MDYKNVSKVQNNLTASFKTRKISTNFVDW